ncbi:MAG: Lsm family RNA-binding protein [Desulfurococcales archaeon]|nr:Lsm family RNA-binding protein [Desulfurococcales archaeon]MEB3758964.1 Lsm family RNA-binding protein [Desulfurococcales archaeon]MEB3786684.1 Lsm family RNA-binding protein [Desulfurococcales archaeon]MEB3799242.1 Lsm family RNA-binding protein [Desulfurococcales archaeon]
MSVIDAQRKLVTKLNTLLGRKISVRLVNGQMYTGTLEGFDHPHFNLLITNATDKEGNSFSSVIIRGEVVAEIIEVEQKLFDPVEFKEFLIKKLNLKPYDVTVIEEAGSVVVLKKITVSEKGVEGVGPMVNSIHAVFQEYMKMKKKS